MEKNEAFPSWYALLDSGDGVRVERLGDVVLMRPAKLAVWKRQRPELSVDFIFEHKRGWTTPRKGAAPKDFQWQAVGRPCAFSFELQENGQVGVFPEHAWYLPKVLATLQGRAEPRVLNLFAYTGLCTCVCALAGAQVTHVELSKRVIDRANDNLVLNQVEKQRFRFIKEDALTFLRKEARRGSVYDVVVCDPPSFSRVAAGQEWDLAEVLPELVSLVVQMVAARSGAIFFTNHHYESGAHVLGNLLRDASPKMQSLEVHDLVIPEQDSPRVLPAGFLAVATGVC